MTNPLQSVDTQQGVELSYVGFEVIIMAEITKSMESPSFVNGVLHFYEGDTFTVSLNVRLKDQDGEYITIDPDDKIEFTFYDKRHHPVHDITFYGSDLVTRDGSKYADLHFGDSVTAKFYRGNYTYRVRFTHGDKTTTHDAELIVI